MNEEEISNGNTIPGSTKGNIRILLIQYFRLREKMISSWRLSLFPANILFDSIYL